MMRYQRCADRPQNDATRYHHVFTVLVYQTPAVYVLPANNQFQGDCCIHKPLFPSNTPNTEQAGHPETQWDADFVPL